MARALETASLPILALSLLLAPGGTPVAEDTLLSLVPGHYALVGRLPDGGAAYSGTAVIRADDESLTLQRTIGKRTVVARGSIEVPSPPGEGRVVRFRWREGGARRMTCLVQGDLDNYARLSCLLENGGQSHRQPGLEAYFSTAAWPTR